MENNSQKGFTDANDNDYYCHADRERLLTYRVSTTLLTLLPVFLSQLGCWLFFLSTIYLLHLSCAILLKTFSFFEKRREVFQLSIDLPQVHTVKNIEEN
ncbi:hypothetical protein VH86_07220 [Pantoea sp. BL1]|nr:hypothetical protein VH86_07220 [Pantoea sp. BL1]